MKANCTAIASNMDSFPTDISLNHLCGLGLCRCITWRTGHVVISDHLFSELCCYNFIIFSHH